MSEPLTCPKCGTELQKSWLNCPKCEGPARSERLEQLAKTLQSLFWEHFSGCNSVLIYRGDWEQTKQLWLKLAAASRTETKQWISVSERLPEVVCRKCGASTKPKWIPVNNERGQTIGFTKAELLSPEPPKEGICQDCRRDYGVWFAPNEIWNLVIPERVGMLCPVCFMKRAEHAAILFTGWQLRPENFALRR